MDNFILDPNVHKKKFENIEMETRVETDILRTGFDIGFLLKFLVPDPKQKPYIL